MSNVRRWASTQPWGFYAILLFLLFAFLISQPS